MKLSQKIKTALDETRILILGSQILLGFQFSGLFQDGYDQLPQHARYLDAVGLIPILSVVALLIAPALYHRTIARGEDTGQLHLIVSGMATVALLPFALSLGIALFIGMERVAGLWAGITAGVGSSVLALFCWYG